MKRSHAGNVILGSFEDAWYTEHVDTTFVTVSQVLVASDQFFVLRGNLRQSLTPILPTQSHLFTHNERHTVPFIITSRAQKIHFTK